MNSGVFHFGHWCGMVALRYWRTHNAAAWRKAVNCTPLHTGYVQHITFSIQES